MEGQQVTWEEFGRFILYVRRRRGLSQERLARSLGCDRTYIWRLEHGRNRPSNIFLHNLRATAGLELAPKEDTYLVTFMRLRSWRYDAGFE